MHVQTSPTNHLADGGVQFIISGLRRRGTGHDDCVEAEQPFRPAKSADLSEPALDPVAIVRFPYLLRYGETEPPSFRRLRFICAAPVNV